MYLYLAAAIVLEVIATTCLKVSDGFTRLWPSVVTAVGYAGSFYCLSIALRSMSTGVAYAIWSGVGIVLISLLSWLLFKQRLDAPALIGMGLIMAGVIVINTFSRSVSH
ncbi:SMR family transporter [Chitinimonas taiwanensis]|jgi:small multidrug resistance pump